MPPVVLHSGQMDQKTFVDENLIQQGDYTVPTPVTSEIWGSPRFFKVF